MLDQRRSFIRRRIAVLAGGTSSEREVSLASGGRVLAALEQLGHNAELLDPSEVSLQEVDWSQIDLCFLALHGGAGEDGRVQRQLENLGVCYTGSGPAASRLAMSKSASKERFRQAGLPTLPDCLLHAAENFTRKLNAIAEIGFPLVVKPEAAGSSLGVSLVHALRELPNALEKAFAYDSLALAEAYAPGREITVAVLSERVFPLIEIELASQKSIFDYQAKYHQRTIYKVRPDLPAELRQTLETTAIAACRALGTRGLVRVDFMLGDDGSPWILEINTIPGMTGTSLAPRAAMEAGWSFEELCEAMILDAVSQRTVVEDHARAA